MQTEGLETKLIIDVSDTRSILKKEEVYGHTIESGYYAHALNEITVK